MLKLQRQTDNKVELTLDGVNSIKDLLNDHLRERDHEMAKMQLQLQRQNGKEWLTENIDMSLTDFVPQSRAYRLS
jgi:hypothetical protein